MTKSCSPTQDGQGEKLCNQGGGQGMAVMVGLWQKILITTIQANFVLNPSEDTNRPELKIFAIDQPSQPFLGRRHLDFKTFSPWPSCVGLAAPIFTA